MNTKLKVHISLSTGLPELDTIINGVLPGDNIVWQVDSIADYLPFVLPFCQRAVADNRELVYFRFADHQALLPSTIKAEIHELHPEAGFEPFISEIFDVIEEKGSGACYLFDSLSELAVDWYSDRMLANFFLLTCPYLYDYDTASYFALLRNSNSAIATNTIRNTAQVVFDVYYSAGVRYIHPLKVYKRYGPTMYMLHAWENSTMVPVTMSAIISELLTSVPQQWLDFSVKRLDVWTRAFAQAQQLLEDVAQGVAPATKAAALCARLLRMAITRDERLLELAARYFDLTAIVAIGKRMIGTGLIGGKSVGMLLSRAIIRKNAPHLLPVMGAHDSFFIGSDVFFTYLIQNGCWWMRCRLIKTGTLLDGCEEVRQRMLTGTFSDEMKEQFVEVLNYFGQSPIIVRSSSLLEDAYGNAFSGKYESVFCTNQGTPAERLEQFMNAVRTVYASTMRKEALTYRAHWGLLDRDEQMALLVQRVSGAKYNDLFFPQVAGVGFSFNPYVWHPEISAAAGMIRLVFGLGTRAVDRSDDDYTRVVALNAPHRRPEGSFDEVRKYAQRRVDVLDLKANELVSRYFEDVVSTITDFPLDTFASRDEVLEAQARENGRSEPFSWVLTFESLLQKTSFVGHMREMLQVLAAAYNYPVDIEFTANFVKPGEYRINLVQCRPFHVKGDSRAVSIPHTIASGRTIFVTHGPVIGASRSIEPDRLIYVVPSAYSKLTVQQRYGVARLIGRLTHCSCNGKKSPSILLLGPGRWGTQTLQLGVPVSFSEIKTVSALCEIAFMHEGLIPDVSLGTHFFNDLVEMDMIYMAVYPEREHYVINNALLDTMQSRLLNLIPDAQGWNEVVRVFEGAGDGTDKIKLDVDAVGQEGICYLE